MSTVRVYRSTDPGAPAHPSDIPGSMTALLRACLVEGYGSINIDSLSVSGGVGTAVIATNSLDIGTRILIAGANEAALNAEWRITAADASSVTLDMAGVADQTASGTITASIPGAGWEEPYAEATNIACFQAAVGVRQFLQIDDNLGGNYAVAESFDSMTDVSTGTGSRGSCNFGKTDATTYETQWFVVADEKTFYMFLNAQYGLIPHGFGEFFSYLGSDGMKSFLAGHQDTYGLPDYYNSPISLVNMCHIGGSDTGAPIKFASALTENTPSNGGIITIGGDPLSSSYEISSEIDFDSPAAGTLFPVFPAQACVTSPVTEKLFRGKFRGLYFPGCFRPYAGNSVVNYDGKDFMVFDYGNAINEYAYGQVWLDISGSWEESV